MKKCYFIEYILGISQRHSSKDELNQNENELESMDQSGSIGKLINDITFFEKETFENCYKRYHSEKDLETLFENAHNILVNNKSIAEGVDFKQLEEVMDCSWSLEKQEHDGNEIEAYDCLRKNIPNKILHGWVVEHLPDGRGKVGK